MAADGCCVEVAIWQLLQAFTFLAMEPPETMTAEHILKAKVELLRSVQTLSIGDAFLGQFTRNTFYTAPGVQVTEPGYTDDPTVPAGSKCPTFAAVELRVNNSRWRGVPFIMRAGKGLDERLCEVRMRMKPRGLARRASLGASEDGSDVNELVMRIQPDEALYMKVLCKEPGLGQKARATCMNMSYSDQFKGSYAGDAYERMFLNSVRGDQSLFVSAAELTEAWRIFTPLLREIESKQPQPVLYPFGVGCPPGFKEWASTHGGAPPTESWMEWALMNASQIDELTALFHSIDANGTGVLHRDGIYKLARRFYAPREPPQQKIDQIIDALDASEGLTLEKLIRGASLLHRAFGVDESDTIHF